MRSQNFLAWLLIYAAISVAGCQYNPLQARREVTLAKNNATQEQELAARDIEFKRRAEQLDVNNRDLHTRLAQSQRKLQLLSDEVNLLRNRLGETTDLLAQAQSEHQHSEKRLEALQASTKRRGGAIITANNSLRKELPIVSVPGVEVRQDDDVIRIELASDQMFLSRSASLHQGAFSLLDPVVDAIQKRYPRQRIGVEGHSDNDPVVSSQWRSHHQLTVSQASAVFEQLVTRYRLNPRHIFVLGHGANHPRVSNATPAGKAKNRRVDIVIYPETVGS